MRIRWKRLLATGFAALVVASCEEPFEPIQASDFFFSIYGALEATIEDGQRQWVRVTPIRTTLATTPEPVDAVVTLEEVETGARVFMTDSLVRYLPIHFADTAVYAHNFSTTMPLVAGRHYRLIATRSDGAQASATVRIPVVTDPRLTHLGGGFYSLSGVRHLGLALGMYELHGTCPAIFRYYQEYLPVSEYDEANGEPPVFRWNWATRPPYVAPPPPPPCDNTRRSTLIVASGEPWPWRIDPRVPDPGHPRAYSNIEGGLGFLVGVQGLACFSLSLDCRPTQLFDGSLPW